MQNAGMNVTCLPQGLLKVASDDGDGEPNEPRRARRTLNLRNFLCALRGLGGSNACRQDFEKAMLLASFLVDL